MERNKVLCSLAIGFGLAVAGTAHATLVLEYDFNNPVTNSGATTTANFAANGGSTDADLLGNSDGTNRPNLGTTNTASTGLGTGVDPRLQTGYLSLRPGSGSNPGQALGTANKNSSVDHLMSQYMGSSTFQSGSMVMFIKPQITGTPQARQTFFWTGSNANTTSNLWLMSDDNNNGLSLRTGNGSSSVVLATIANVSYDPTKWYMIAASWDANGVPGAQSLVYIRAVDGTPALSDVETGTLVSSAGAINTSKSEIFLGRRRDNLVDDANADYAMFQLYNNSTSVAGFDTIFNTLAPEPTSASLIILAGGFLMRRRHRRA